MRREWYRDLDVEAHQELSGYALYGMVQANVGQKRLKRNILRRFF
jgi:hypothetical protein